jgi:hypothetical protein
LVLLAGASGSTIRGLVINRVTNVDGINLAGVDNCTIEATSSAPTTGTIARGNALVGIGSTVAATT